MRAASFAGLIIVGVSGGWSQTPAEPGPKLAIVYVHEAQGEERRSLRTVSPVYPRAAVDAGLEGSVIVCFSIDADGNVSQPAALSSTHPVFEGAAVAAAAANAYAPVAAGQVLHAQATCLRYRFRL